MNWLPLESEMLASVAYDEQRQMLHLRFRGTGDVYRYFEGLGKENLAEAPEKCFPDCSRHPAIRK